MTSSRVWVELSFASLAPTHPDDATLSCSAAASIAMGFKPCLHFNTTALRFRNSSDCCACFSVHLDAWKSLTCCCFLVRLCQVSGCMVLKGAVEGEWLVTLGKGVLVNSEGEGGISISYPSSVSTPSSSSAIIWMLWLYKACVISKSVVTCTGGPKVKGENSFPERVLRPTVEYVKENMCQCRVYSHISLCSH